MLKYLIQTSIFRYSKNYGSLTHETRIKDSVNMEDLICLLATIRTLKLLDLEQFLLNYLLPWKLRNSGVNTIPKHNYAHDEPRCSRVDFNCPRLAASLWASWYIDLSVKSATCLRLKSVTKYANYVLLVWNDHLWCTCNSNKMVFCIVVYNHFEVIHNVEKLCLYI